jgi:thiol-disulfide isomerase/thioredoxin
VGASVLFVVAVIAYGVWGSLSPTGSTGSGSSGATAVGEVTGPPLGSIAPAPGMLAVGTAAPDLSWTLDSKADSIAAERGHPLFLEFFATWCPHCQAEAPIITKLAQRYTPQGIRVIGVSASPLARDQKGNTSIADIQAFSSAYGAQYPLLLDRALIGAQRYGVRGFPTMYVVDQQGTIRYATSGEVPEQQLVDAITPTLASGS